MKSKFLPIVSATLIFLSCNNLKEPARPFSSGKWIDLSYDFSDKTLYWPTASNFKLDTVFEGQTPGGYFYSAFSFSAAEHGGTHLDAPFHFAKGKWSVDEIPLENLTGEAIVIDVSNRAKVHPDYLITVNDVNEWEAANGKIPVGAIVIFNTGYGSYYPNAVKYLGTDEKGPDAVAKLHFPGVDPKLAEWIVANRKIKALGIDTPSIDYGQSKDFKTHQVLYAQNICGFENVANVDQLPVKGAYIVALPMKIKGGSGAPLRIVAFVGN